MTEATELWRIDLAAAAAALAAIERRTGRISDDEAARARLMADREAAEHWLASRTALRLLVERWRAGAAARAEYRRMPFKLGAGGRPHLADASLCFSLAHSAGIMLLAIGRKPPVGVDVEPVRRLAMPAARAALILAAGTALAGPETRFVETRRSVGGADGSGANVRGAIMAWTRIEALAQARGPSLAAVLDALGIVGAAPGATTPALAAERAQALAAAAGLAIHDLVLAAADDGRPAVGALALAQGERVPRLRILPPDAAAITEIEAEVLAA
jgi:4'-phosphopantetheinyl transferase